MIYSVSFSPDDVEFPSYEIATVAQPADVAQAIYSDIHTKRRAFYISPGAYVVAEIDDEDNDYIVEFLRGDEFMALHNVPAPSISPFRVWRPVQVAPGLPTHWVLESVSDRFVPPCTCRHVVTYGDSVYIGGEGDCPVHGFG